MSLYGLVICGGESTRMGTDKSLLVYYQKPQYEHVADLLAPLCEHVIICCNDEQFRNIRSAYKKLPDNPTYGNAGPMTGLLTAYDAFPGNDFLVAGCDYPYLTTDELANFLQGIDKDLPAAAFYDGKAFYEPLLAWYAHRAAPLLAKAYAEGYTTLQGFLHQNKAGKHRPESALTVRSVDTQEAYRTVKRALEDMNRQNGKQFNDIP